MLLWFKNSECKILNALIVKVNHLLKKGGEKDLIVLFSCIDVKFVIKLIAYDNASNNATKNMTVWRFF